MDQTEVYRGGRPIGPAACCFLAVLLGEFDDDPELVGGVPLQHQPSCPDQEWWELNQSSRRDHVLDEVLAASRIYAAGLCDKGKLAMPRARRFAIFTCMDAQVTRNAWGRASSPAEPKATFSGEPGLS